MDFKKQFMTVTPISKIVAMVVFILLPFVGFCLGIRYRDSVDVPERIFVPVNRTSNNTLPKISPALQKSVANIVDDGVSMGENSLDIMISRPYNKGVRAMLIDSSGRKTGISSGEITVSEIPHSTSFVDAIAPDGDPANPPPDSEAQSIYLGPAESENYSLQVTGGSNVAYGIRISGVWSDNNQTNFLNLEGKTKKGIVDLYKFSFSTKPGEQIKIIQQPTN